MDKWKTFLDHGFTTFPEHGIESRSDCHAWSAHPMYDFLNITCGVESTSPGFKTVEIRPQPGRLTEINATMPHPSGNISVALTRNNKGKGYCEIELPAEVTGYLIYNNKSHFLTGGKNEFLFKQK